MNPLLISLLVATAAIAVATDLKQRRISNKLTFGVALAALAVRFGFGGTAALIQGGQGWLLGVALFLVPFALGWMGAGDVKLLAAFGALGGPEFVILSALLGCIAGGLFALFCLVREGKLWFTIRHFAILLRHPFGTVLETKRRMPFGPALALGAGASLVLARGLM